MSETDETGVGVSEQEPNRLGSNGRNAGGPRSAADVTPIALGALQPEDAKLVTLARSARLRAYVPRGGTASAQGAAVRDTDGRTYAAATVENADARLTVSALAAAVVAAASSGARRFEAAAIVSQGAPVPDLPDAGDLPAAPVAPAVPSVPSVPAAEDLLVLGEFGAGVPVFLAGPDGVVRGRVRT